MSLFSAAVPQRLRDSALSGLAVHFAFHLPDAFDQGIEFRRVIANDAGGAHGLIVGSETVELVFVGNEPQPAVEAMIVVGVPRIEEDRL